MKKLSLKLALSIISAALLTGCSVEVNVNSDKKYDEKFTETKHFELDDPTDYSSVDISLKTGGITVKHTDEKTPFIDLECRVFGKSQNTCQEVSNHITSVCRQKDGVMQISIVEKVSGKDIDEWIEDNDEECRVEIDAVLNVPSKIDKIDADVEMGNITLKDIAGNMNAYVNVGNITCSGTAFTSDSYIECNTGNITSSSCICNALTMFKADTGNIDFGLPAEGSDKGEFAVLVNTGTIDIREASAYKIQKGDPKKGGVTMKASGCTVTADVRSGKINMDSKENTECSTTTR